MANNGQSEYDRLTDELAGALAEESESDVLGLGVEDRRPASRRTGARVISEPQASPAVTTDQLAPAVKAGGNIVCRIAGVSKIEETEAREFADTLVPILEMHKDLIFAKYAPYILCALKGAEIVAPRVAEYQAKDNNDAEPVQLDLAEIDE